MPKSGRDGVMRAFLLGVLATLLILGVVLLMANRMHSQELVPRAYLPLVMRPHRVKAALSQCCTVPCDKVWDYGAEWVSGWSPLTERCGAVSSPMIRDMNQWEAVKAGTYDLDGATMPIQMLNEPENQDCAAGACMTLTDLITVTHEIITAYPDKELTSPAFLPRWAQQSYGLLDWVDGYQVKYGEYPRFEVLALHAYGTEELGTWSNSFNACAGDYDYFLAELAIRGYTGLRVWITEMGYFSSDPHSMPAQMDASNYLNAWIDKCDSDDRCEYLNWFGITQGDYWFVAPLEFNDGTLSEAGKIWRERFN